MTPIYRLAAAVCLALACASSSLGTTNLGSNFDSIMTSIYDPVTGIIYIEHAPVPGPSVHRLTIASASGQLLFGNLTYPTHTSPPVTVNTANSSLIDIERTGHNVFGTGSFLGNILATNLSQTSLQGDLTIQWMALGGSFVAGDLIHAAVVGASQINPVMPGDGPGPYPEGPGTFQRFFDVASGQFVDPPMATGYEYAMDSASLFTAVGFPFGLGNNFTIVSSEGVVSGFGEGGYHQFSSGVSSFKITGINPPLDGLDPMAFPVFLEFSTPTADFNMTSIPEPNTFVLVGLALLGACGRLARRR